MYRHTNTHNQKDTYRERRSKSVIAHTFSHAHISITHTIIHTQSLRAHYRDLLTQMYTHTYI